MSKKSKLAFVLSAGIAALGIAGKIKRFRNDLLIDSLEHDYQWDGIEDPRYEYGMYGLKIGKDGLPKRRKK